MICYCHLKLCCTHLHSLEVTQLLQWRIISGLATSAGPAPLPPQICSGRRARCSTQGTGTRQPAPPRSSWPCPTRLRNRVRHIFYMKEHSKQYAGLSPICIRIWIDHFATIPHQLHVKGTKSLHVVPLHRAATGWCRSWRNERALRRACTVTVAIGHLVAVDS